VAEVIIKVEHLSKKYRLGTIGTGTLSHDLKRWWQQRLGKEDQYRRLNEKQLSGEYRALNDINFEINRGDAVGVIGKNGAGKSTLLKILSRVTSPTTGSAKIGGRIASLLEVGTGFHPELTGRDNIYMNGAILGMTKAEITSKFDEIVEFSGVEKYIDTPVKRYSSGMYVRLAFAVAAHLEPEILIVDEVLAVGDAEFQRKCLGKMNDISKSEGRTILFVSHNMASISNLCTKGLLLANGSLICNSNIKEAINHYLSYNAPDNNIPIAERSDRKGNGSIKFESVIIEDIHGNPIKLPVSGQTVVFKVRFIKNATIIKNIRIDLALNNSNHERISWFSSSITDFEINTDINRAETALLVIKKLPLMPGRYSFTLNALVNGEYADWVPNAFSFDVESGDFFNTGKLLEQRQGNFLVEHKFVLV
jgi:lipopolysaccharide transport system ATP-binding protein